MELEYERYDGPLFHDYKKLLRHLHNKWADENPEEPYCSGWIQILKDNDMYDELIGEEKHQMITLALPNEFEISKILKYISKPHSYLVDNAVLAIERFSDSGENLHVHILKKGNYSKSKIIRDMSKKFKIQSNFVDVRYGIDKSIYQKRLQYVQGEKTEKKELNVEKDKIWRKDRNLKDYYNL